MPRPPPGVRRGALPRRRFLATVAATLALPHVARGWSGSVDAALFGVRADGVTDNAPALNAAIEAMAGAGGTLRLAPGRYRLGRTVWLKSGITLAGPGATLFADTRWVAGEAGARVSRYALLANRNAGAAGLTDRDIAVRGLGFEYGGPVRGDAHAVTFRRAEGITVSECQFSGGGNGTAFLACRATLVERCVSQGTVNCAYDHWEGSSDGIVRDSRAACRLGYGILFTGQGTARTDHQTAAGLQALNNRIETPGPAAIWVCSLSEGSAVTDVVVRGNHVQAGPQPGSGIGGTGAIRRMRLEGNTIEGMQGGNPLFSRTDKWHRPADIAIIGNRLVGCTMAPRNIALIQALGDRVTVTGNRATGGSYRSLVWADGEGVRLADNHGDGLTSRFKYNAAAARAPRIDDP